MWQKPKNWPHLYDRLPYGKNIHAFTRICESAKHVGRTPGDMVYCEKQRPLFTFELMPAEAGEIMV
jgi:hypothetical protein